MIAPQEDAGARGYKMKSNVLKTAGGLKGGAEPVGKNHCSLAKQQRGKQLGGALTHFVCV